MTERKDVRVVIVDDDYIARLINRNVVESFNQFNVYVDEANGGTDALELISKRYKNENKFPQIIILDCAMPVMSGFDFIEELKQTYPTTSIEIIIVTASDNPEDIERSKNLGVKHFLTKPLTFEKLKFAILETLTA